MDDLMPPREILQHYTKYIGETPTLQSLLYDADLLPEQIISARGAISVAAVVEAYKAGLTAGAQNEHH